MAVDAAVGNVRKVLLFAGKVHHAPFVIRPVRCFVGRLLQLSNLHLNGAERAGGGAGTGSGRKRGEVFMCRINSWWTWGGGDGLGIGGVGTGRCG